MAGELTVRIPADSFLDKLPFGIGTVFKNILWFMQGGGQPSCEEMRELGKGEGYILGHREGLQLGQSDCTHGYDKGQEHGLELGKMQGYMDGHKIGFSEGQIQGNHTGFIEGHHIGFVNGQLDGFVNGERQGYLEGFMAGFGYMALLIFVVCILYWLFCIYKQSRQQIQPLRAHSHRVGDAPDGDKNHEHQD